MAPHFLLGSVGSCALAMCDRLRTMVGWFF